MNRAIFSNGAREITANAVSRPARCTDERHTDYNYAAVMAQPAGRPYKGEREGLSVFVRDGDRVFHSYSAYQRGLDLLLNTYNLLDLTPAGRNEDGQIMGWVKYHDQYEG